MTKDVEQKIESWYEELHPPGNMREEMRTALEAAPAFRKKLNKWRRLLVAAIVLTTTIGALNFDSVVATIRSIFGPLGSYDDKFNYDYAKAELMKMGKFQVLNKTTVGLDGESYLIEGFVSDGNYSMVFVDAQKSDGVSFKADSSYNQGSHIAKYIDATDRKKVILTFGHENPFSEIPLYAYDYMSSGEKLLEKVAIIKPDKKKSIVSYIAKGLSTRKIRDYIVYVEKVYMSNLGVVIHYTLEATTPRAKEDLAKRASQKYGLSEKTPIEFKVEGSGIVNAPGFGWDIDTELKGDVLNVKQQFFPHQIKNRKFRKISLKLLEVSEISELDVKITDEFPLTKLDIGIYGMDAVNPFYKQRGEAGPDVLEIVVAESLEYESKEVELIFEGPNYYSKGKQPLDLDYVKAYRERLKDDKSNNSEYRYMSYLLTEKPNRIIGLKRNYVADYRFTKWNIPLEEVQR
ncbi:MAG: hypothetical protein ACRC5C_09510 [Bacilli bacterium]